MRVAVIDLGKTNAKLAWVDTCAAVELAVRTMPSPVLGGPPYPHLDTVALETFIVDALREGGPVEAITVTTHGATVALLDSEGELALPVLDYEHTGPDTLADAYDAARSPFERTGSPRLPGGLNVGAQLFWQRHAFPDAFARVRTVLTWPQYWVFRLCGERVNDPSSLGAHTDLHEPATGGPSSLVEQQGWTALMPPVGRSGERLGTLGARMVERTGLAGTTAVHVGIHDSNASLVPHLLTRPEPFSVVSTGTWVIAMVVGGEPVALDETRDTLVNVDAFGRPVPSARFMGGREYALLTGRRGEASLRSSTPASTDLLSRLADASAWLLPATVPGTGPFPDDVAEWTVERSGLDERFGAGAVDSVIAGYLAGMTLIGMGLAGAAGETVVEGPFAQNENYLQALAAGTGRALLLSSSRTGTSIGAAMLIGSPAAPLQTRTLDAEPELAAAWRRYLGGWHDAVAARREHSVRVEQGPDP